MPTYDVEVNGKTYEIDAPKVPTREEALSYVSRMNVPQPTEGWSQGGNEAQIQHPSTDPEWMQKLKAMLETAAHPKQVRDFLGLLIPSELGAVASAAKVGDKAPSVAEVVKAVGQSPITKSGPSLQDIAVGTAKGIGTAVTNPTKTAIGAAAGSVIGGHEGAAVGAVIGATSDILRSIKAEVAARLIANVNKPGNVQMAFKAVQNAAKSRGVRLTSEDMLDVLKDLSKTDGVSLEVPKLEAGRASAAVSGPNRIGSASYGARGDLKAWVQHKIASQPPPPQTIRDILLTDAHGNAIAYK